MKQKLAKKGGQEEIELEVILKCIRAWLEDYHEPPYRLPDDYREV